jgi:hypothetical protein
MRKALTILMSGALIATTLSVLVSGQQSNKRDGGGSGRPKAEVYERRRPIREPDFGVEVVAGGSTRENYPARGRVYIEAVEGEEYGLRLYNPLPVRVAVALSVDGLNTIDARRTTARDASKWVIPPYSSINVSGWQMSSTRLRRFYFTNERDSYANKLGRPSDTGVISAVFFRERREHAEIILLPRRRPHESQPQNNERSESQRSTERRDAPSASADKRSASGRVIAPEADDDYAATGIGSSVSNDVWRVQMDLESQPAAEVTIRYEFREALVRLGVLPRSYPQHDALRRRERARGFADGSFSPEP